MRREHEMDAKIIVQMDGKKTRLLKPKQTTIDNNNVNASQSRDNFHDFTFDYSYWSFEDNVATDRIGEMEQQQHVVTQDEVYNDLGMDVINCAFQGSYYFDIYKAIGFWVSSGKCSERVEIKRCMPPLLLIVSAI